MSQGQGLMLVKIILKLEVLACQYWTQTPSSSYCPGATGQNFHVGFANAGAPLAHLTSYVRLFSMKVSRRLVHSLDALSPIHGEEQAVYASTWLL